MKIAIVQPYLFPYLGYFQLIESVDKFVFYDDVNFIKKGWINRNQILVNQQPHLFTVPLMKVSQNKLINETIPTIDEKWLTSFMKTLLTHYQGAPYFYEINQIVKAVFEIPYTSIADLAINSIKEISNYLELKTTFEISSKKFFETKGLERAARLIAICKIEKAKTYINPSGGIDLYNKEYFEKNEIELFFIQNKLPNYPQFHSNFISGLSIIDVLMFNNKEEIKNMLNQYTLV